MEDDQTPRLDESNYDQEMQELHELFSRFKDDQDADFISLNRLTEVLQAFGRNPSLRDSEEKIAELDAMGRTELTFEEFLQILDEPWTVVNNDRDALRQALEKFDDQQEGYIDIDRFRTIMTTLGEPLSDEEIQTLIQLGSNDDQTKISIDYLLDQLLGNNA